MVGTVHNPRQPGAAHGDLPDHIRITFFNTHFMEGFGMATAHSYIPGSGAGILDWTAQFLAQITAETGTLGLSPTQVADYTALQEDYATKYAAATNHLTRGTATILAKNEAKTALVAESRKLAMQITNYPGVTNTMRQALGLTLRDDEPTPVPVPEESPRLEVLAVMGRTIKVRLSPAKGESRARPEGVKGATLYYAVGETYSEEIAAWTFKGNTSLTTFDVTIPTDVPGGSKVWLVAAWFNTKSQAGPVCSPVETRIAGGLAEAA